MHDKGLGFVPDQVVAKPVYVLIGEAPGSNEVLEGKPFIGKAGFVLKEWLIKAVPAIQLAMERGQVTIMNTLRCLPPEVQGRAYPKGEEKRLAEAHCRQYDNMGEAETVVLFGESPQRCWFGEDLEAEDASDRRLQHDVKGVSGRIGREVNSNGRRYIFAPHPAYILRQPALVTHGQRALAIAADTEQLLEVEYLGWNTAIMELGCV